MVSMNISTSNIFFLEVSIIKSAFREGEPCRLDDVMKRGTREVDCFAVLAMTGRDSRQQIVENLSHDDCYTAFARSKATKQSMLSFGCAQDW